MINLGTVKPGSTIRIPFSSFDKDDGSSITMTNYAAADILIYKDGGTTERASTAGFTATTDFDSKTGKHLAVIDLADNTTAGFYAAGSEYLVAIDAVTVDAVTTGGWVARFVIGYPDADLNTTIASLSSQTSFTLTAGPAEDDALNGCVVAIHDIASAIQMGYATVADYTGSTKTVTLTAGVTFTAAAGDNISIFPPGNARWFAALLSVALPLTPTTAGRALDVSAGGEAGIDWANIGSPTTAVNLSATNIDVDQVVASVSGTVATVTTLTNLPAIPAGWLTATGIAADAFTAAKFASDVTTELQAGLATASALSTVSGKIDTVDDFLDTEIAALTTELAKVPKSDGTATWNATALAAIQSEANDALVAYDPPTKAELDAAVANVSVDEIQPSALADLFNTDSGTTYGAAVAGSVVAEIADNAGGSALTAAAIADAVWDEALAGHAGAGSAGEALSAAGTAGDPWTTALPGAYGSGTAGKIIGDNINATISSRATQTSVDTVDDLLDTEVAAIFNRIGAPVGASISADIAAVKTQTAAIEVDTADIQARIPAALVGGRIDATVDGTGMETGAVTAIQSGLATATELAKVPKSDGTATWNATALASLQAEATDALNAYDPPTRAEATSDANSILTAVDALPTNAELATALGTADDAVLAQVALVKANTDKFANLPVLTAGGTGGQGYGAP